MSAHQSHFYVQGDESLPDMRLRHRDFHDGSTCAVDGLARELAWLSWGSKSHSHWAGRSSEHKLSLMPSSPSFSAASIAGSSTSKKSSTGTTSSSSSKSSSDSSRVSRHSADNDRQIQLDTRPIHMLDRWLAQTTRQDPFHGLSGTTTCNRRERPERR